MREGIIGILVSWVCVSVMLMPVLTWWFVDRRKTH